MACLKTLIKKINTDKSFRHSLACIVMLTFLIIVVISILSFNVKNDNMCLISLIVSISSYATATLSCVTMLVSI